MSNPEKDGITIDSNVWDEFNQQQQDDQASPDGGHSGFQHSQQQEADGDHVDDVEARPKKSGSKLPVYIALVAMGAVGLGFAGFILNSALGSDSAGKPAAMQQMEKPLDLAPPAAQTAIPGMTEAAIAPAAPASALAAPVVAPSAPAAIAQPLSPVVAVSGPAAAPVTPVMVSQAQSKPVAPQVAPAKESVKATKALPKEEFIDPPKKKAAPVKQKSATTAKKTEPKKQPVESAAPAMAAVSAPEPAVQASMPVLPVAAPVGMQPVEPFQLLAISPAAGGFPLAHLKRTSDGKTIVVRVGDRLPNGATVEKIDNAAWSVFTSAGAIR